MDRIKHAFETVGKRAALMPFLNAGDPTYDISLSAMLATLAAGADIVEIGMPYSDPLADGPVIQASALRSLNAGFSLPRAFDLTRALRAQTDKGLVLFTYVNPVLQYGYGTFFTDAKAAGADGVIIPDLPFEESEEARQSADAAGIQLIPLVTPTSGEDRIRRIALQARGFVYCVSSLGVTGERARMSDRLRVMVGLARKYATVPIAVGFGVSTPDQAREIAEFADGVIVGSAFVRRVEQAVADQGLSGNTEQRVVDAVSSFAESLIDAVR